MLLVILIGAYLTYERPASAPMTEVADPEPSGRPPKLDFRTCIGAPSNPVQSVPPQRTQTSEKARDTARAFTFLPPV
ncbi:TPA: hypothetical protein ACQQHD_003586 [Pseudomonas aeruginosa]|uniref:hypothetical protein n=1 Tax=Pseudomonas aeruginosa TaxID=287 RepID=UPI000F4F3A53|nr:hypothetical protein [Pseudomonas aeruginosa]EKT8214258.1 hypothetical protein [Pseudomonas aeruginosa]ELF5751815.1 hypothetical protein [Pseudomonas aeruginosa]ELI5856587.1 hypothetical protein [Pseudomonas aeruginosa]MCV3976416.1 hypothetical protein [Pseudomonas aeruginosa]RTS31496.1 hypothetical protein DY942_24125 [Pseudomonas aeruginosa]